MKVRVIDNGKITNLDNEMRVIKNYRGPLRNIQDRNIADNIHNNKLTTEIDRVTLEYKIIFLKQTKKRFFLRNWFCLFGLL